MKRLVITSFIWFVLSIAVNAAETILIGDNANIRAEKSTSSKVLGKLMDYSNISKVIDEDDNWYHIYFYNSKKQKIYGYVGKNIDSEYTYPYIAVKVQASDGYVNARNKTSVKNSRVLKRIKNGTILWIRDTLNPNWYEIRECEDNRDPEEGAIPAHYIHKSQVVETFELEPNSKRFVCEWK